MRKCLFLLCVIVVAVLFTGCSCEHEWEEATCVSPQTCLLCEETKGEALGHSWSEPTCIAGKTCTLCGLIDGDPLEHTWETATCKRPEYCLACEEERGTVSDHCYTEKLISDKYLCSAATLSAPATYYYACVYCGDAGTSTYSHGTTRESLWIRDHYTDYRFGDLTDEWYICPRDDIEGTFENTATNSSKLTVKVLYDRDGDITIFLYEYGDEDNLVKNNSSKYSDFYEITIRNDAGKLLEVRGRIWPGGDRICVVDEDVADVLAMMKTAKTLRFYIVEEDSPTTKYRFTLDLTDFKDALDYAIKNAK